jgi:hypothetical protein
MDVFTAVNLVLNHTMVTKRNGACAQAFDTKVPEHRSCSLPRTMKNYPLLDAEQSQCSMVDHCRTDSDRQLR